MFLVEFGVWSWWTYELWLIIDGIIVAPAAGRVSCCLYWMCAVWCVEMGMRRGVWWSLILPFGTQNIKCNTLSGFYICLMMTQ
jgi:hypothetical protein